MGVEGIAHGQTMMDRKGIAYAQAGWETNVPLTQVCMEVDAPGCIRVFEQALMSDWLRH